jgi:hypothetical protein
VTAISPEQASPPLVPEPISGARWSRDNPILKFEASQRRRGSLFYILVTVGVLGFAAWDVWSAAPRLSEARDAVAALSVARMGIEILASFYVFSLVLKSLLYGFGRRDLSSPTAPT